MCAPGGPSCLLSWLRFPGLEGGSPLSIDFLTISYKHLKRKVQQSFAQENSEISGWGKDDFFNLRTRARTPPIS